MSLLILSLLLALPSFGFIEVDLKPTEKISTSDVYLNEGDCVNFEVLENVYKNKKLLIKKSTKAQGIITHITHNGFGGKEALIVIEQIDVTSIKNKNIRLDGEIYVKGNSHQGILDFLPSYLIRGGESHMDPDKHTFKLFLKD